MTEHVTRWKEHLYRSLYAGVMCGIVLSCGHTYMGIAEVETRHWIAMFLLLAFLFFFCIQNGRGRLFIAAGAVVTLLVLGLLYGFNFFTSFWKGYADWAMGIGYEENQRFFYHLVTLFLLTAGGMLLSALRALFFPVRILCLGGILLGMVLNLVQGQVFSKIGMAFLFLFLLLSLTEAAENHWRKERRGQGLSAFIVWLWPVWLLYLLLLSKSPSASDPYRWGFVQRIYRQVSEGMERIGERFGSLAKDEFDVSMSGFAESTGMKGDVKKNSSVLLTVSLPEQGKSILYLAGMVLSEFDGREWTEPEELPAFYRQLDALETLYAVSALTSEEQEHYVDKTQITISYRGLRSGYFFTPAKATALWWNRENLLDRTQKANRAWKKKKKKGDSYELTFYQVNGNRERIRELTEQNPEFDEKRWNAVCRQNDSITMTKAGLAEYRKTMRDKYGDSREYSGAVRAWVEQVTKECETPLERLYAMEKALQGMKYTRTPGVLPEMVTSPETFLDYFLLEKQEGYCTYFATAFVLLARAEGWPARLVKGFLVQTDREETEVNGNQAHAWPEVYFEGAGWIAFEPTPGYEELRYLAWVEPEKSGEMQPETGETKAEDGGQSKEQPPVPTEPPAPTVLPEEPLEEQTENKRLWQPFFAGITVFTGMMGLIFCLDLLWGRRRYEQREAREKFCLHAGGCLRIAAKLGIRRQEGETLSEFGIRLTEAYSKEQKTPPVFWSLYEEVLYGEKEVTGEMLQRVKEEQLCMLRELNRRERFVERYRLERRI